MYIAKKTNHQHKAPPTGHLLPNFIPEETGSMSRQKIGCQIQDQNHTIFPGKLLVRRIHAPLPRAWPRELVTSHTLCSLAPAVHMRGPPGSPWWLLQSSGARWAFWRDPSWCRTSGKAAFTIHVCISRGCGVNQHRRKWILEVEKCGEPQNLYCRYS